MKKKMRTLMATMLALTLILGSSMTTLAAEKTLTSLGTADPIPVTISYSRANATGTGGSTGGDDTTNPVYNILIAYDNLSFSYEADTIIWNPALGDYEVTLKADTNGDKGIEVTNRSNAAVSMTPSVEKEEIAGVTHTISLDDTNTTTLVAATPNNAPKKDLTVTVAVSKVTAAVQNFTGERAGSVNLMFSPAAP